jgi:hypothetical protein
MKRFLRATSASKACALLGAVLGSSCTTMRVPVPPPGNDTPPEIIIANFVLGSSGTLDQQAVTSSTTVFGSVGAKAQVIVTAKGAGGLSKLSVLVHQGVLGIASATVTQARAPDNTALNELAIVGTDGSGGAGTNPIVITVTNTIKGDAGALHVVATAENFNGGTTVVDEQFITDCGCEPPRKAGHGCQCLCSGSEFGNCGASWTLCCGQREHCCFDHCADLDAPCVNNCPDGSVPEAGGQCCPLDTPVYCEGLCWIHTLNPCGI